MEDFRAWPPAAYLSPHASGKKAIAVRTFALGALHSRDRGNPESCRKGEHAMKWAFWRRERRNEELQEEIQAHLRLAEREAMESGRTQKEARYSARREFGNVAIAEEVTRD